jgi:hypothetical protein
MRIGRSEFIKLGLFLLIAMVGGLTARSCAGDQEHHQALELKKLANAIAPYPQARANGDKVVFKSELVYYFTYYVTQDDFNQVKEFYDQPLKAKGWAKVESPPSIFLGPTDWRRYTKGDYAIVLERDDSQPDHFDLVLEWNPGQK